MNGNAYAVVNNKTQEVVEIRMTQDEASRAASYQGRIKGSAFSVKPCTYQITQQ